MDASAQMMTEIKSALTTRTGPSWVGLRVSGGCATLSVDSPKTGLPEQSPEETTLKLKSHRPPVWATRLIREVLEEENVYHRGYMPDITWQKRKLPTSSGQANSWHMRITAGTVRSETKQIVLHELCHVILARRHRGVSHPPEFYALLFTIGKRHRVGAQAIKRRECWYKPQSLKAGYRLYLRQTREARPEIDWSRGEAWGPQP